MDLDDDADHDKGETPEQELLERAKKRHHHATQADRKQRERERNALRFQVPEFQWDDAARRQRLGNAVEGVPTPARPVLSIPKLDHPIRLVLNQEKQAKLGINLHPLSPDADDDTAEIMQGLYRSIERDSQAGQARSWAFERAVEGGTGCYRVNTRYDDTTADPYDQVIVIERILHQGTVHFDPAATKPDFSDGEFVFVDSWVSIEEFKREWPEAEPSNLAEQDFKDVVAEEPDWVRGDGDERAVLVTEYFYKVHEIKDVGSGKQKRKRDTVTVRIAKVTGFQVLEDVEWNGKLIPIIPAVGRELQPFDAERRWVGIIEPNMDAQRVFNYAASNAIELVALEPRAPFIGVEGQFEGHEAEWLQANTRNWPYLEYVPKVVGGQVTPAPQRAQVDVGRLGPTMALLQQADQFLQSGTAMFDPSLGRGSPNEKSGRAIAALQGQAEAGSSDYLINLAEISLAYEARVVLDLIPKIYDRPGRVARLLDLEDNTSTAMLGKPYIVHPKTKRPFPVKALMGQDGQPVQPLQAAPEQGPIPGMPPVPGPNGVPMQPPLPEIKHHDLTRGVYSVAVTVGRSRQTAMQEGSEELGQILQTQPQLMPILGPLYFKFRDFPGSKELGKLLEKMRDKQFPFLSADGEQGPSTEQLQGQLQGMGQQMQALQQQLQQAVMKIQTDQAKQEAMLAKAQMDNQSRERIEQMRGENALLIQTLEKRFDMMQATLDRSHESSQAERKAGHDLSMEVVKATAPAPGPGGAMAPVNLNPPAASVGEPLATPEGTVV